MVLVPSFFYLEYILYAIQLEKKQIMYTIGKKSTDFIMYFFRHHRLFFPKYIYMYVYMINIYTECIWCAYNINE